MSMQPQRIVDPNASVPGHPGPYLVEFEARLSVLEAKVTALTDSLTALTKVVVAQLDTSLKLPKQR